MTRLWWRVVVLVAGCGVVAGCGSGVTPSATAIDGATTGGTAASGSVLTSSATARTTAALTTAALTTATLTTTAGAGSPGTASASFPESLSTASADPGNSAAEASSTVIPAELDTQSAAWFEAVCEQMNVDIPAAEGDLPPQAIIGYVKSLSAAMVATAQIATKLTPPTIDGGAELATALAASMSSSGTELAAQVDSFLTDMEGANPYSADSSVLASKLSVQTAFEPLIGLDPAVKAALGQFPACQTYGF